MRGEKIMAGPTKKKQVREEKNDEQSAFDSALNSEYKTITPMVDAAFARFHHPFKGISIHCSTDSDKFMDTFAEFCQKGLAKKMVSELSAYAVAYDSRWSEILDRAAKHSNINIADYLEEKKV